MLGLLVGFFAIRFKPMYSNFQFNSRADLHYLSSYNDDSSTDQYTDTLHSYDASSINDASSSFNQYTASLYNPVLQHFYHACSKRVDIKAAFSNHVDFDFDEHSSPEDYSTADTFVPSRCL